VRLGGDYREIMLTESRRGLAEAVATARQVAPTAVVEDRVIEGFPVPVLREESRQASMLALGDRGYGGVSGLILGSVASAMAGRAACPIVLVRAADEATDAAVVERTRPVVVGVDGSPHSDAAVAFAFESASRWRVSLVALHSLGDLLIDAAAAALLDWAAIEAEERRLLSERISGWTGKYPDVAVELVMTRDRPAAALVDQSRTADMVVVGSRGRGAAMGLLLGSVSHAVLHKAHCPVAVVRGEADEEQ
jgi:nucleotide-binding universal stress UspA family protein